MISLLLFFFFCNVLDVKLVLFLAIETYMTAVQTNPRMLLKAIPERNLCSQGNVPAVFLFNVNYLFLNVSLPL